MNATTTSNTSKPICVFCIPWSWRIITWQAVTWWEHADVVTLQYYLWLRVSTSNPKYEDYCSKRWCVKLRRWRLTQNVQEQATDAPTEVKLRTQITKILQRVIAVNGRIEGRNDLNLDEMHRASSASERMLTSMKLPMTKSWKESLYIWGRTKTCSHSCNNNLMGARNEKL